MAMKSVDIPNEPVLLYYANNYIFLMRADPCHCICAAYQQSELVYPRSQNLMDSYKSTE